MKEIGKIMREHKLVAPIVTAVVLFGVSAMHSLAQQLPLAAGVEKLCSFDFNKDSLRPARVENSALPCLEQAAKKLKDTANIKLVLVGISHPLYDHEERDHGMERMKEDATGEDIRFTDVAAYRAVNAKAYLTQWLGVDPAKIIPTTDEYTLGRKVIVYTVPGDAHFYHNYTKTTPTNESKCTIKPCPNPEEDVLTPQSRPPIPTEGTSSSHK